MNNENKNQNDISMKNYDLLGLDNPIIIDRKKHLRRISTGMK